jgi:hypothetical protein
VKHGALAAAVLSVGLAAHAQSDERVLIALVENHGSRALVARLEAELLAMGFRVERVRARTRESLAQVAARRGALAVVMVRDGDGRIELWGEHPDSGATAFSEVVRVDPARKDVSAVTAVESLRGRLLRLGVTPDTRVSEVAPAEPLPPPPAPILEEPSSPVTFGAFFAGGAGAGVSALTGFVRAGVHLEPTSFLSIALSGAWQPITHELAEPEGSASLRIAYLSLGADLTFDQAPLSFGVGPAFAVALVDMEGTAGGDYRGVHAPVWTVGPLVHGMVAYHVLGPLHLRADAELGIALPRVAVSFAGRDVARWGAPFGLGSIGADLKF